MFTYLYEWVEQAAFYLIIVTVALEMLPNRDYQKYIRFFTGLVLILLLSAPLLQMFGMDAGLRQMAERKEYREWEEKIENAWASIPTKEKEEEREIQIGEIEIAP